MHFPQTVSVVALAVTESPPAGEVILYSLLPRGSSSLEVLSLHYMISKTACILCAI